MKFGSCRWLVVTLICCVAVTYVLSPQTAWSKGSGSARVLSSQDRSLTLEFAVRDWMVDTTEVSGEPFLRFDFKGANLIEEPGLPQIPYHVALVGIPLGARVSYSVVSADFESESDVKLVPFADLPRNRDGTRDYIFDRSVYDGNLAFPSQLVKIDEPAMYRDQQIVRVQVAAAQFVPGSREVRKYDRIVLQLTFSGGEGRAPSQRLYSKLEESLFENAVLNYEESRRWRADRPTPSLAKSSSLFASTTSFYRMNIREEGIYRIDGNLLRSLNIDLSQIDPGKIRLFNNGGRELPRDLDALRQSELLENAIFVSDGGDGSFDAADFILFSGRGVQGWTFNAQSQTHEHYINHYGFDNVYWLSLDGAEQGKRMTDINAAPTGGLVREQYRGLLFVEEELDNPLRSGLNWFGRQFAIDEVSRNQTFNLDLTNLVQSSSNRMKFRFMSRSSGSHRFDISLNNTQVATHQFTGDSFSDYVVMTGSQFSTQVPNQLTSGTNSLRFTYSNSQSSGQAFLDWFEVLYDARLTVIDNQLAFSTIPESGTITYRVAGFSNQDIRLFDVTDFANAKRLVNTNYANGQLTFSDVQNINAPKRYLALHTSRYKQIESLERVDVRDLREPGLGAEFIIIAHADFQTEAQRLESLRENGNPNNRLETEVVLVSDIYNNFSGGLVDVTAIRDFIKFTYDNWSPRPAYVLLFGDGDYDYKNIINSSDRNWIPPFQTDELNFSSSRPRLEELVSRTTDSWYTYVSGNDIVMDVAIGRLNVQSLTDAKNAVDKIIAYETQPLRGSWRNTVTVVGDDELVGGGRPSSLDDIHIGQIERIAETFIPKSFDIAKIYLPEFPKVISASVGGIRKPAAQEALLRQLNKGTLIVNFVGHGNDRQWAHEVVFEQTDNERVLNEDKLTFFVAATCDWALYDNPQRQSQAEELLLAEGRGAIATLSSARLVFSQTNARFNEFYNDRLFATPGQTSRIGDAFVQARMITNSRDNDEKFHIYGDPTLRLAMPQHEAVITSITPDSILALNTMKVSGEVRIAGQVALDFNGKALVNTFDSKQSVRNIPEAGFPQNYFLPGNSIYRGTVPVENGRFSARFIVPKDISYGGNLARISTYFWNDETDGAGNRDNILVSSSSFDLVDSEGPELKIYFRGHENFTTGDIIGENVTLVVELADTVSGINIAGELGHRLTLTVDPDEETCLSAFNRFRGVTSTDLTDLFQFKEGDHLRGTIEFAMNFPKEVDIAGSTISCVGPGGEDRHTLLVKAWDNSNNSSTAAIEVLVAHEEGLVVRDVMNYPNPFRDNTTFTFISNQEADVTIKIYTISGQLIHTLEYPLARNGFNMVDWDGRDGDGDIPANGVYLYKLIARSPGESGTLQKEVIGRLAIIR